MRPPYRKRAIGQNVASDTKRIESAQSVKMSPLTPSELTPNESHQTSHTKPVTPNVQQVGASYRPDASRFVRRPMTLVAPE